MSEDVYIFGYQSILATGSLATSVTGHSETQVIPARVSGYVRDWSAVREFRNNQSKRYVHISDWSVAERVAFANLVPCSGRSVNGVCRRIPRARLGELDFREQGYVRANVTAFVAPYAGYELDRSITCYTYIDPSPDFRPSIVSRAYYDMGRLGSIAISRIVPTFSEDYLMSTHQPSILADDLAFVFFSGDAGKLWLLQESDSSLILLYEFTLPQFIGSTDNPPELARPITQKLQWFDVRHRILPNTFEDVVRIPERMARKLVAPFNVDELSGSPYWLCRLVAADSRELSPSALSMLRDDPDSWVRRAAQLRR